MQPYQYELFFPGGCLAIPPDKKLTRGLGLIYYMLNELEVLHPVALEYALEYGYTDARSITTLFTWADTPIWDVYWRRLHDLGGDIITLAVADLKEFNEKFRVEYAPWEKQQLYFQKEQRTLSIFTTSLKDKLEDVKSARDRVPWNYIKSHPQWKYNEKFKHVLQHYPEKVSHGVEASSIEDYIKRLFPHGIENSQRGGRTT